MPMKWKRNCIRMNELVLFHDSQQRWISMNTLTIPFQTINWSVVPRVEYKGETGTAFWQTVQYSGLRIRIVHYSPGYRADHWCSKGHIVQCLEGEFVSELNTGEAFTLSEGAMYVVTDEMSSHRSVSTKGATLLIIDGDFLGKS